MRCRMTNREMLIQALQNFAEESCEDCVTDYIDCPYTNNCLNEEQGIGYADSGWTVNCSECKRNWLGKEFEE